MPAAAEPDPEFASPGDPSCPPVYGDSVASGKLPDAVVVDIVPLVYYVPLSGDVVEVRTDETDLVWLVFGVRRQLNHKSTASRRIKKDIKEMLEQDRDR